MMKATQDKLLYCTICNKKTRPKGWDKKFFWLIRLLPSFPLTAFSGQSGFTGLVRSAVAETTEPISQELGNNQRLFNSFPDSHL